MDVRKLVDEAFGKVSEEEFEDAVVEAAERKKKKCKMPGKKIRSKGKGRGLARGGGEGPIGVPFGSK